MSDEQARSTELRDYLDVLTRRKWVVVIALIVVLATGVIRAARETKVYRASAQILVAAEGEDNILTQVAVINGQAVREKALEAVPGAGRVSASPGQGRIVNVSVEDTDPQRAAAAVSAYIQSYVDHRDEQRLTHLLNATEQTRLRVEELRAQVEALSAEYDAKAAEIDERVEAGDDAALRDRQDLDLDVKVRRDALLRDLIQLESTLAQQNAAARITEPAAEVVNQASVPSRPVRPDVASAGVTAAVMGLMLGIALAFLFEYLDESIKTKEDIQRAVGTTVPVVATIPAVVDWRDPAKPQVVTITAPRSSSAEAYRALRTSVQFAGLDHPVNSLAITSPTAGEGKTSAVANLAVVMAASGRRVVMFDCDLRRPRIHSFFGLSNEVGFTSWIIGAAPLAVAVQDIPGVRRLQLLASGPIPPNPSELLSSRRFQELVKILQADGALVIVDTPPLLPVTDAAVIARSIDALFVVTMAGRGTRRNLRHAMETLQHVEAPVAGIVLNAVDLDRSYYYKTSYYSEAPSAAAPAWLRRPKAPAPDQKAAPPNGSRPIEPYRRARPPASQPEGETGQAPHSR